MKQHIFNLLIIILLSIFKGFSADYVYMSEIMYDTPLNEESSQPPSHNGEFIEFCNAGNNPVNLAGWQLRDLGYNEVYVFPDAVIPPRSFLILCYRHVQSPDFELSHLLPNLSSTNIVYHNKMVLRNTWKELSLYDSKSVLHDKIIYGNSPGIPSHEQLIAKTEHAYGRTELTCLYNVLKSNLI